MVRWMSELRGVYQNDQEFNKVMLVLVHYCNARKRRRTGREMPSGNRYARYTTTRYFACYLGAKMATRTINGMYVNNDTTAITRHRKRHILASVMEEVGYRGSERGVRLTVFYLRVVDGYAFFGINSPSDSCCWDVEEKRSYPPNGE